MSTVRLVLAMALCLAILTLWNHFLAPKGVRRPREQGPPAAEKVEAPGQKPEEAPREVPEPAAEAPEKKARLVLNGGNAGEPARLSLEVTSRGGGISEAVLPRFEARDGKGELVLIPDPGEGPLTLGLWARAASEKFDRRKHQDLRSWLLEEPVAPAGPARLQADLGDLHIEKELRGAPGRYHLELVLTFENRSAERRKLHYRLRGPVGLISESLRASGSDLHLIHGRRAGGGQTSIQLIAAGEVQAAWTPAHEDQIVLIGSHNNYFASVLAAADAPTAQGLRSGFAEAVPDRQAVRKLATQEFGRPWEELDAVQRQAVEKKAHRSLDTGLTSRELSLDPGARATHRFILFMGPREKDVLDDYPELNLSEIRHYGWYTPLVKLFIWILKMLHYVLRSWGLAIIALTVLVRLCLHPVNRRQQASMMRYQKKVSAIKPQLDQLKERYAANRMKMNQEMQKLFKEHGISPVQMMGGCVMILLQLPVWVALYNSLEYSVDLRRAPFLWIEDLTQPDRVLHLPFTVPLLGWTDLNVLPIIYVILTVIQQKMQPKPADPQMQQQMRMMTYMMVFFGFIFYSFPAGFLLYFIAGSAFAMVESKIIKRMLAREGLTTPPPGAAPAPAQLPGSPSPLYPARKPRDDSREKGGRKRR